jgi:hypothetical protein
MRVSDLSPALRAQYDALDAEDTARIAAAVAAGASGHAGGTAGPAPEPSTRTFAEVTPVNVRWLWRGWLPVGKLVMVDGAPGVGKSTLLLEIAARLSRGERLPGEDTATEPVGTLFVAEDEAGDTLVPRAIAAGADLTKLHFRTRALSLPDELDAFEADLDATKVGIVVLDPLDTILGVRDSHKSSDVRRALDPVERATRKRGITLVCIRHLRKSGGSDAMNAGVGSIGYAGAARSAMLVGPDPDDSELIVLASYKCSNARKPASWAYRREEVGEVVRVAWAGPSRLSADELVAVKETVEARGERSDVEKFLLEALKSGPRLMKDVSRDAREAGFEERAVRTARTRLRVQTTKLDFAGGWQWSLPAPCAPWRPLAAKPEEAEGASSAPSEKPTKGREGAEEAALDETEAFLC